MPKRRVVEILLDDLVLTLPDDARKKASRRLLTVSLVWPRPAIAERVAVKKLDLASNQFKAVESSWSRRILFKETVQGPFGVQVEVSEPVNDSQVGEFIQSLSQMLLKLGGGLAEDAASTALAGDVFAGPFDLAAKAGATAAKKGPRSVAAGELDVSIPAKSKKKGSWTLPLTAPRTVYRVERVRKRGASERRRRVVLKEGAPCGELRLAWRVYE
jgi:hypothetical protein